MELCTLARARQHRRWLFCRAQQINFNLCAPLRFTPHNNEILYNSIKDCLFLLLFSLLLFSVVFVVSLWGLIFLVFVGNSLEKSTHLVHAQNISGISEYRLTE